MGRSARTMLNKYEASELIAARAMLLSNGAEVLLDESEMPANRDPVHIASLEIQLGRIDAQVSRGDEVLEVSSLALPDLVYHVTNRVVADARGSRMSSSVGKKE